jgi:hypothetical protein
MRNTNLFVGLGLLFGVSITCALFAALLDSRAGEVAGALGNVLGGAIGALGAAAAVYLTLNVQRGEEISKVTRAVVMEIAQLSKFPSGQLETCVLIFQGKFNAQREKLPTLMNSPTPVIYPGIADQIARHPNAELIVAFYTGLQETRLTVDVVVAAKERGPEIRPADIVGIGVMLMEQCRLAQRILVRAQPFFDASTLPALMVVKCIEMLGASIAKGAVFPSLDQYDAMTAPDRFG